MNIETTTKTNGTNGHAAVSREVVMLHLDDLDAHPDQPRKRFKNLEELAQTIVLHGVLEPILVRPKDKRYQIIFGERRVRASKIAKQKSIPAFVRTIDDVEAEKMMLIENGQREDLHEIEEAEAYERLRKVHGMSVEDIALKVGKTPATVYARMKLVALCKAGREACFNGHITPSVALYIARIPSEKLQLEALAELEKRAKDIDGFDAEDERDEGPDVVASAVKLRTPVSERQAFALIRSKFMLRLVDAPFDIADAKLTKAGACSVCPNRTGNQASLFADVKSADVCTLPTCFADKRDAEWTRREAKAKADGLPVLSKTESKEVFETHDPGHISWNAGYVDVDAEGYIDGKATTYRKKLGSKLPQTILARDPAGGIHELVKKADLEKRSTSTSKPSAAEVAKQKKEREAAKKEKTKDAVERRCIELAIAAIAEKAEGKPPTVELWRALLVEKLGHMSALKAEILIERKLVKDVDGAYDLELKGVVRIVSKMSEKMARAILVNIIAETSAFDHYGSRAELAEERGAFDMLCDFYKVDPKKFQAEAKASVGAGAKS